MNAELLDDLLAVATPADLLEAAAEIVAGEFPPPDANPGPCANCGHTNSNMNGGHERGTGRCHGGLDPCPVRCQRYIRPESLEAKRLRRMAEQLRTKPRLPRSSR